MSSEPAATADPDISDCRHRVRVRDNYWGFASAETTCTTCGLVFDAEREQELRECGDTSTLAAVHDDLEGR